MCDNSSIFNSDSGDSQLFLFHASDSDHRIISRKLRYLNTVCQLKWCCGSPEPDLRTTVIKLSSTLVPFTLMSGNTQRTLWECLKHQSNCEGSLSDHAFMNCKFGHSYSVTFWHQNKMITKKNKCLIFHTRKQKQILNVFQQNIINCCFSLVKKRNTELELTNT